MYFHENRSKDFLLVFPSRFVYKILSYFVGPSFSKFMKRCYSRATKFCFDWHLPVIQFLNRSNQSSVAYVACTDSDSRRLCTRHGCVCVTLRMPCAYLPLTVDFVVCASVSADRLIRSKRFGCVSFRHILFFLFSLFNETEAICFMLCRASNVWLVVVLVSQFYWTSNCVSTVFVANKN